MKKLMDLVDEGLGEYPQVPPNSGARNTISAQVTEAVVRQLDNPTIRGSEDIIGMAEEEKVRSIVHQAILNTLR